MTGASGAKQEGMPRERLRWGSFELLEVVGRGGMATVVRARDLDAGAQEVALKFLHRDLLEDEQAVEAFRLEGRLGMRLEHENLGRTFGFEEQEDRIALILEFIEGHSLHAIHGALLATPFEPGDALAVGLVVAGVARGLHCVHEMVNEESEPLYAVHRDVTPKNILLTRRGVPKLLDFGIAFSTEKTVRTATGMVKGKVAYVAPEYLKGQPWDRRIDVWSTGVVLWELLTGRRLFQFEAPSQTIAAILTAEIPSVALFRSGLPEGLAEITERALERDPRRRFPTARALEEALLECVVRASGSGSGGGEGERVMRWLDRLPLPMLPMERAESSETRSVGSFRKSAVQRGRDG